MSHSADVPLVVDLDGTLLSIDTFQEACMKMLRQQPMRFFLIPFWMLRGRAYTKARTHGSVTLSVDSLPWQKEFLEFLKTEHARGRKLVLATAADKSIADMIAGYLGFFDAIFTSENGYNLKGARKASALVERFGEKGFDYAGNSSADLAVWKHARKAIVVHPSAGLVSRAKKIVDVQHIFVAKTGRLAALLRGMRLHQLVKNALLFVPVLSSHELANPQVLLTSALAFLSFSSCTSAVYLLNDLFDLEFDRLHRTKKLRPLASGELPLALAVFGIAVLLCLAATLALQLPPLFMLTLIAYFLLTNLYTSVFKKIALLDVLVLAILYTLRIIAGSAATGISFSFWLLLFSVFFFFSLALIKRYAEVLGAAAGSDSAISGRGYFTGDAPVLLAIGTASGFVSVLVLGLYVDSQRVLLLYRMPYVLWLECILMLFWLSRMWLLTQRGLMHEDPIMFTVKDKVSYVVGLLVAVVAFLAT